MMRERKEVCWGQKNSRWNKITRKWIQKARVSTEIERKMAKRTEEISIRLAQNSTAQKRGAGKVLTQERAQ